MVIGKKDLFKMIGIIIISFCAVYVCTLFLNYDIDLREIESLINKEKMPLYEAMSLTARAVSGISGGCLALTSIVMLVFYIKQYIDTHGKELGILKALGYSDLKIAKEFWVFGLCIFMGTTLGFLASLCIMPKFYEMQNKDHLIPDVTCHIHIELILALILLPSILFALFAIGFSFLKLKMPVLELLKGKTIGKIKKAKKDTDLPFLTEMRKSTLRQKKTLIFFMAFASFCYASMMQMSASMDELASKMMSLMVLFIGIVLACVTLFLAMTTVINANRKTIVMMKVFGYPFRECSRAILSGYRPIAYIGFFLGTLYQYGLLRFMVTIVFGDIDNVPVYEFDIPAFLVTLVSFAIIYELVIYFYTQKMKKISLKEIMLDDH